jgi:probable rRNA maturation factor
MTVAVAVSIRSGDWRAVCGDAETLAADAARLALVRGGAHAGSVLDIALTDDAEQRRLNRAYRGKDMPTNVLAFPAADPGRPPPPGAPLLLGDIVLALTTIRAEAEEQGKPLADHLRHLVVHGVLHLLGAEHDEPAAAAAMEAREIAILAEMGVPDPYRDTI